MNLEWDKANASSKDGMLKVEFPKRDEAKPRRIMIQ
jgi:HSP20 family molecular chaperone IbpA